MLSELMGQAYRRTWWSLVVRGLLGIALGVFILSRPMESVAALALLVAIWALADGFMEIATGFDVRDSMGHWWLMLLAGVVNIGFGVAALFFYPVLSLTFVVIWVSWWLLAGGALGIWAAFQANRLGLPWGWSAVWGVVSLIGGVYAIMSPGATLAALIVVIAAVGIAGGVVRLIAAFKMSSLKSGADRAVRGAVNA